MAVAADQAFIRARRVWQQLGTGPWICHEHDPGDPLLREILDAIAPDALVRDFGVASLVRRELVALGFISGRRLDGRRIEYVKGAECPAAPPQRSWTEVANEELAREHAWNLAQMRRDAELRAAAQRQIDAPLLAAERATFARQMREALADPEVMAMIAAAVEAALERRHEAQEVEA